MNDSVLVLSRHAVREVDRLAVTAYSIPGIVLMENAARALAAAVMREFNAATPRRALIYCGGGNNGGDGYAAARHLHNAGAAVTLAAVEQPRDGSDAAVNRTICERMGLAIIEARAADPRACDVMVDAVFGTGLDRPVEGEAADVIRAMNAAGKAIVAADIPSGLDCETGQPLGVAIRAVRTVTFVGLKPGMLHRSSRDYTGVIEVADIGAPRELVERLASGTARLGDVNAS